MLDETGGALYALASLGYPASGVGAEVALGEGLIGVAARERVSVRINHRTGDYTYQAALQVAEPASPRIPLPVLAHPHSQIAVPRRTARLLGVLYAESGHDAFFSHADEDALVVYGRHLGALPDDESVAPASLPETPSGALTVTAASRPAPSSVRTRAPVRVRRALRIRRCLPPSGRLSSSR